MKILLLLLFVSTAAYPIEFDEKNMSVKLNEKDVKDCVDGEGCRIITIKALNAILDELERVTDLAKRNGCV